MGFTAVPVIHGMEAVLTIATFLHAPGELSQQLLKTALTMAHLQRLEGHVRMSTCQARADCCPVCPSPSWSSASAGRRASKTVFLLVCSRHASFLKSIYRDHVEVHMHMDGRH